MTVRQEVIAYIESNPEAILSPSTISHDTGLNPHTVRRTVREILLSGIIEQTDKGQYLYVTEERRNRRRIAFVYMFKGYSGGTKWFLTYTTDHELSGVEIQRLILSQSGTYGNIELVSQGTTTDYDDSMIGKWEYEDTGEES